MNQLQIDFLIALYNAHFDGEPIVDWKEWASENDIPVAQTDRAFEDLSEAGLVEAAAMGSVAQITSRGILFVEENSHVAEERIHENRVFRTKMLDALAKIREEHGAYAAADWQGLCTDNGLSEALFDSNERFLQDLGLIQYLGVRNVQITGHGMQLVNEWRDKIHLITRLDELRSGSITASARGTELEKLVEEAAKAEGWRVERNVRATGEELDVIVSKEFNYFIISCKWLKDPVEAKEVRDLRERVTHRAGARGILFSMSSFTSGAEDTARERIESAVILLFGPKDIERALSGEFTALLDSKFHEAMTVRRLSFE